MPVRLVKMPDDYARGVDTKFGQEDDRVSLADGMALLITNQHSLDDLQTHFTANAQITMRRFRPNIVLEGLDPWEEDVIKRIKIGDVEIELVKPCSRCQIVNIDPETAEISEAGEPMRTLVECRRGLEKGLDGKGLPGGLKGVFFGQNAQPRSLGRIQLGDRVEILERREIHPALAQAKLRY